MTLVLQCRTAVPEAQVRKLVGQHCTELHASVLLREDADVYKPDGSPLLMLRRGAIPELMRERSYPALHHLRTYKTSNRGVYGGAGARSEKVFADGVKSKNTHAGPAASAIIGYFARQGGRHPHCRTTAFTANEVAKWTTVLPLINHINNLFLLNLPSYHATQLKAARLCNPAWVIEGTAFSTITVNNNAVAGIHRDAGDYKAGFGIISCLRRGDYAGGLLCFPTYRVAVDLQDGDVLFFNPHEWHGMTPIQSSGDYERITCVYYLREKMVDCGTPEEELANAKKVRGAL